MIPTVLFDNILVKKIERETVKNGLIIPSSNQEPTIRCEVVFTGGEVKYVSKGDILLIAAYRGTPLEVEDQKFLIIKEEEILAILKD
jgi:chaperonin GroES